MSTTASRYRSHRRHKDPHRVALAQVASDFDIPICYQPDDQPADAWFVIRWELRQINGLLFVKERLRRGDKQFTEWPRD